MDRTLKVHELNEYLKASFEYDEILQNFWLVGQISNVKHYHLGGQVYFTLSDELSSISCVMFQSYYEKLKEFPAQGTEVIAKGSVRFFNKKGTLHFQCVTLLKKGEGSINAAFEALKQKLHQEGLFEVSRKKNLPKYPEAVALVTAYDSAAMWDVVKMLREGASHLPVYIVPAVMQGANSAQSIIEALATIQHKARSLRIEAVILARGGGSGEDLASFNDEALVRFIAQYSLPLVSAIGHEVDITLCDFVADLRVPTPTAAGQLFASSFIELKSNLSLAQSAMHELMNQRLLETRELIENVLKTAHELVNTSLQKHLTFFEFLFHRCKMADPLYKLRQGFSITRLSKTQEIVTKTGQINKGDILVTQVSEGQFLSEVL